LFGLPSRPEQEKFRRMDPSTPTRTVTVAGDILPPDANPAAAVALTPSGQAALATAQAFTRKAAAANTLRAYKADWTHFADWCAAHGFVAVPAAPATVGPMPLPPLGRVSRRLRPKV
jgi:hypothetical protein